MINLFPVFSVSPEAAVRVSHLPSPLLPWSTVRAWSGSLQLLNHPWTVRPKPRCQKIQKRTMNLSVRNRYLKSQPDWEILYRFYCTSVCCTKLLYGHVPDSDCSLQLDFKNSVLLYLLYFLCRFKYSCKFEIWHLQGLVFSKLLRIPTYQPQSCEFLFIANWGVMEN